MDVILTAVRWYTSYPLSTTHVTQLLAERHIDVSARTVLDDTSVVPRQDKRRCAGYQWWPFSTSCYETRATPCSDIPSA